MKRALLFSLIALLAICSVSQAEVQMTTQSWGMNEYGPMSDAIAERSVLNFLLFVISFITIVLFHLFGKAEIANSIPWTYFVINAVWCIAAKMNLL